MKVCAIDVKTDRQTLDKPVEPDTPEVRNIGQNIELRRLLNFHQYQLKAWTTEKYKGEILDVGACP